MLGSWTIIYLGLAGIAAGLASTVVGMASLVAYPVLLSIGLSPLGANVTNTAAMILTGVGSGLSSARELNAHRRLTAGITLWALLGGLIGSLILVTTPPAAFEKVVPWLVLMAAGLMLFSARSKKAPQPSKAPQPQARSVWWQNLAVFAVGVYIGYFGASAGTIFLAVLSVSLPVALPVSNAIKNFAIFVTNILALIIYAVNTTVQWGAVVPLGLGMFVGGYLGPTLFRKVPERPLRIAIGLSALVLAGYLAYTSYWR